MKYAVVIIAIAIAGCVHLPLNAQLAVTCRSYSQALSSLVAVKHELSQEQVQTVNEVRRIVNPICYKGGKLANPKSYRNALDLITVQIARLNDIQYEVNHDT